MTPVSSRVSNCSLTEAECKFNRVARPSGVDTIAGQRDEIASTAAAMQAKVGELTQIVSDREGELEQKEDQVAKDRNLLEHDQDI